MALKKKYPVLGEELKEFKITGGPSDWDLWLCQRGTNSQVTFYSDTLFMTPGKGDPREFLSVKIITMKASTHIGLVKDWIIKGRVSEYKLCDHDFEAYYNTETRKGEACLKKIV